jgi:ATP-dependent DNA ligase
LRSPSRVGSSCRGRRYRRYDASVFLYAFDLVELNGDDLRREPLEVRRATLATVLKAAFGRCHQGGVMNEVGSLLKLRTSQIDPKDLPIRPVPR